MNRRQFLRVTVGLAVSGSLAGCSTRGIVPEPSRGFPPRATGSPTGSASPGPTATPTPEPVPYADAFDRVVDVVEAGAEPDGSESITPLLRAHESDSVLFSFPPGTYLMDPYELEDITEVGLAAAQPEPPVIVPAGPCSGSEAFIRLAELDAAVIDGFIVDFNRNRSGGSIQVRPESALTARNLRIEGSCATQIAALRFDVTDPDGVGLVEGIELNNPADSDARLTGAFVGEDHAGEITFRDCVMSGFSDNGLYGSAPGTSTGRGGVVHVEGGQYHNNNIANVRLGTRGSTARDVSIRVDEVPPHPVDVNVRGIRLRGQSGQLVEDCRIELGAGIGFSLGGVVLHHANGRATVRNTHITIDNDETPAVNALAPNRESGSALRLENLTVDGAAAGGSTMLIDGRPGTTITDCRLVQPGADRAGLRLVDTRECTIEGSYVEVGGAPIWLEDSTLTVENTTFARPGPDAPEPVTVGVDGPVVWDSDDPTVGNGSGRIDWWDEGA